MEDEEGEVSGRRLYQGVELAFTDADVMEAFQQAIGTPIPPGPPVHWDTFGFNAANGHIIALGIYHRFLPSLPDFIGELKALESLFLFENRLTNIPDTI